MIKWFHKRKMRNGTACVITEGRMHLGQEIGSVVIQGPFSLSPVRSSSV